MATKTLFSTPRAVQTIELLAPILGAFLCAHALTAEQDGVGELVFVRPVSSEKVLLLRLALIFGFVFAVLAPAFVLYVIGIDDFPLGMVILATLPSVLALSLLAMVLASTLRHPLLGFAGAGAFWALDLALGGYFNPLVSLHGYADYTAGRDMSEQWILNKTVLLAVSALLYVLQRRVLGTPAPPRRWSAAVRGVALTVALAVAYVASGAACKMGYGLAHERDLGYHARAWYQRQFGGYGPIPVARMFGRAFVLYVQAEPEREGQLGHMGGRTLMTRVDVGRMREVVERFPDSMWADNAQFEIANAARKQLSGTHWVVAAYQPGNQPPRVARIAEDLTAAAGEFQSLADRYPESPFAPLALAQRAAIGLRLLDLEMARQSFERLLETEARGPEMLEAGMSMSAVHLREGASEQALRAAEAAGGAAPWDRRAEALLAAARAVHQSRDMARARERYQQARAAAEDAVERAIRGEKTPSSIAKSELFERMNAVMRECDRFLDGQTKPPAVLPRGVQVSGQVAALDLDMPPARVAIGREQSRAGLPSPFLAGPAVSAATDGDGAFRLEEAPPGLYRTAAVAVQVPADSPDPAFGQFSLPLRIGGAPVEIPPVSVSAASSQPPPPPQEGAIGPRLRQPEGTEDTGRRWGRRGGSGTGDRGGRTMRRGGGGSRGGGRGGRR
jgi:tetratricopeptide (TPR) repeat protein